MAKKQAIGFWGQKIAENHLIEHGYEIIDRNFRTKYGEIDLVAKLNDDLIFVEVKTRTSDSFGFPENAITANKQNHMVLSAEAYIEEHPELPFTWRLDVIAVQGGNKNEKTQIEWFENIGNY
jgi:putative endonuclease